MSPPSHNRSPGSDREKRLKSLAHDLGNLANRLSFLGENLRDQLADPGDREEATALLADTTERMRGMMETLREVAGDD